MKVRIKHTVSGFLYEGRKYLPGEDVEIPDNQFQAHFMVDLTPKPKPVEVKEEPIATAETSPITSEPFTAENVTVEAEKPQPKARKRRQGTY